MKLDINKIYTEKTAIFKEKTDLHREKKDFIQKKCSSYRFVSKKPKYKRIFWKFG